MNTVRAASQQLAKVNARLKTGEGWIADACRELV